MLVTVSCYVLAKQTVNKYTVYICVSGLDLILRNTKYQYDNAIYMYLNLVGAHLSLVFSNQQVLSNEGNESCSRKQWELPVCWGSNSWLTDYESDVLPAPCCHSSVVFWCRYVIKTYNVLLHLFYKHITCEYINSLNHTASLILSEATSWCLSRAVTNLHIEAKLLCSQHYIIYSSLGQIERNN